MECVHPWYEFEMRKCLIKNTAISDWTISKSIALRLSLGDLSFTKP